MTTAVSKKSNLTPAEARMMGIGVMEKGGELIFLNDKHKEAFYSFRKKSDLSIIKKIELGILTSCADPENSIMEDVILANFMIDAIGIKPTSRPDDILRKEDFPEKIWEMRSQPFHFKTKIDKKDAFTFLSNLGLNLECQPGETEFSFWVKNRRSDGPMRKMHELSAYLWNTLGIESNTKKLTGNYYFLNTTGKNKIQILVNSKLLPRPSKEGQTKERDIIFERLKKTFSQKYNFFKIKGTGIRYELKSILEFKKLADHAANTESEPTKEPAKENVFFTLLNQNQWEAFLQNCPKEILDKFIEKGDKSPSEKLLEEIEGKYFLISKTSKAVDFIIEMKPETLNKIKEGKII